MRKRNWRNTFGAKTVATVLSAAMAFSGLSAGMPAATAMAEDGQEQTEGAVAVSPEASSEASSEEGSEQVSATEASSEASAEASSEEAAKGSSEEKSSEEKPEVETAPEVEGTGRSFDDSKIDAWDFGAESLGDSYNNRLDVTTINGFYTAEPGSTGVNLPSFSVDDGDFVFNDGGYPATHRLRTTNTALTRFDEKSLKDTDGNAYTGYIYSNKGKTDSVYVALECKADDIVTAYVASNGTDSEVHFVNTEDASEDTAYVHSLGSSTVSKMVFYPASNAQYKLYSATEKLVVARVLREHASYSYLTGSVEGFEGTGSFDLVFTNAKNGNEVRATVSEGKFEAQLAQGFDYTVSLEGADEYVLTSETNVNISEDTQMNMTVSGISLVDVTGKVTGIADEDAAAFVRAAVFSFIPQDKKSVFVPAITLTQTAEGIEYELKLQQGVTYDVSVADKADTVTESFEAVEDYTLLTTELTAPEAAEVNIEFEAKPVYKVTIAPVGATAADLAEAVFTFTRLDTEKDFAKDGYVYTFTGTEDITLRDGQYVVEVTNSGAFVQKLTSNLVVKGEAVTKEIAFSSEITEWDFSDPAFTTKFAGVFEGNYNGLSWTNGRSHNNTYLYSGAGTISVPVKGACQIQVTGNYQYSYYFENENEPSVAVKTGSTSQNDTFTYDYKGGEGTFEITVLGTSYLTKIATVYQTEYKPELLVGSSDKAEFATIGEALAAVRLMNRKEGERVTVMIEPGNYEEMLVIDTPNVTLANASAAPTNTLKNSGVDIDDNAVRVTWYYGHGYTYYSMGSDYKYDAEVLAANKANGYASVINPGSGTGTYWNATVVVDAAGFEAKDIIFENSFNQYMSQKAAEDVIVPQSGAKEGSVKRSTMSAGDTTVQDKKYVERAAALALTGSATESYFENCRIIGRQDTLYGHEKTTAAFYNCAVYGGTDFIFGAMTAVFAKCDLVLNTMEDKNDVAYITAAQQKSASTRGYLMYNCTVKSTEPGVDTASKYVSKPGQFGRPWQANTSEVVFFNTVVEATNWANGVYDEKAVTSLIQPAGWNATLSGESARNVEFGTYEVSGENNSKARAAWVSQPETPVLTDGKAIAVETFLGDWDPFAANGKDMTITFPEGPSQPEPETPGTIADDEPAEVSEYVFEASDLTAFAAGAKADGDFEKAGTEDYFTLLYSAKTKVDSSNKSWEDGYTSGQRVNFGGAAATDKNSVKFTTSQDNATLKIWWASNAREMVVLDSEGTAAYKTESGAVKNTAYLSTITLEKAGTYYLGGDGGTNYIFKVQVTDGVAGPVERKAWADVAAPVIETVALNGSSKGKVDVTVKAVIGNEGGDALEVRMFDAEGKEAASSKTLAENDSHSFTFAPKVSGDYTFVATLSRDDEEEVKTAAASEAFAFVLPLTAPQFKNATNKGAGTVAVKFYSVSEADNYVLVATDKTDAAAAQVKAAYKPEEVVFNTSTEYSHTFVGLTVGHTYELSLFAMRGEEESKTSVMEITVTKDGETEWTFAAFGSGVDSKSGNNGYSVNDDGSVSVWSLSNKGKIVPASTDGLSFYYATLPADQNFTLTATATIDKWAFTNGQEGFGLMAADRVGVNGDASVFWNNSYMASGTKVEYFYDKEKGEATKDETDTKVTMKLGLGAQEKAGVTTDNLSRLEANDTATVTGEFSSNMYPLETSCAANGSGTYNLFGKETSGTVVGTVENPLVKVRLRIQKNNTGYFVSYLDESGNVLSVKKFYDTKALENLDKDHVYVGFFASRTFKATFSDIELITVDPEDDAPAEDRPKTQVAPNYKIISSTYSNTAKYELQFCGNADGALVIKDEAGKVLADTKDYTADSVTRVSTKLNKGNNTFTVTFTPNADFHPNGSVYYELSSYETAEFTHTVNYATINDAEKIYVTPDGKFDGAGTAESPVDIHTAVKYVQPGQTIVLASGTYNLSSTVKVDRGIDGTPSKPIKMVAENGRAVFDFGRKCAGFIFAGNYWYVKGIDCTRSANSLKGIQVSGSHITLEDIRTYENGNTGIQVSRYLSTDAREDWPSYDLILNCTSYSNADAGYEDADGFAAKLTIGDGIVFDGCISYNNADDGWDLFAKVETGSIGQVTIKNSVAFANGYGVDGKSEGNGNGFKMGGSSITGPHKLINSVAFNNKAKGIDSNSGPDIQVYHSTSFNNGSNNVALYTNDTANTDFYVNGVLSYRTEGKGTNENIKAKGSQDGNKIYGKLNFFWKDKESANSEGLKASDDWFVSLDAPKASVEDPYAVAAAMRTSDGRIDLGDFLKLSDTGIKALEAAGIQYTDVTAVLNGSYTALGDQKDIDGSAEDAANDEEQEEEEELKGSFVTKWGATYFVTEDGKNVTGLAKIEDSYYYFRDNGKMLKGGEATVDGKTFFFDNDGKMVIGLLSKWGTVSYYDLEGGKAVDKLVDIDGDIYYFNAKAHMVKSDFVDLADGTHYFDGEGKMVIGRTITKWLKKYTFDENGVLVK